MTRPDDEARNGQIASAYLLESNLFGRKSIICITVPAPTDWPIGGVKGIFLLAPPSWSCTLLAAKPAGPLRHRFAGHSPHQQVACCVNCAPLWASKWSADDTRNNRLIDDEGQQQQVEARRTIGATKKHCCSQEDEP